jgi:hypothetical protein
VNLQATTGLVQFVRDVVMDQPYVTLIENREVASPTRDLPPSRE